MNIDVEDLVCFVYQQVNKITTALTSNNFDQKIVQKFEFDQEMPDLLIQFLLEDQNAYLIRRTALDMQTNLLCAKCEYARRLWYQTDVDENDKKNRVDQVDQLINLLRFSAIKKAVQTHEQKMRTSLEATLPSENTHKNKTKI
jgi:hypothetical protein